MRSPNNEELTHETPGRTGDERWRGGLFHRTDLSPGKYARSEEIASWPRWLRRIMASTRAMFVAKQEGLIDSLEEAFQVGRAANSRQISHLKLSGNLISPQPPETIRHLERPS
jgi:hypothetical protein